MSSSPANVKVYLCCSFSSASAGSSQRGRSTIHLLRESIARCRGRSPGFPSSACAFSDHHGPMAYGTWRIALLYAADAVRRRARIYSCASAHDFHVIPRQLRCWRSPTNSVSMYSLIDSRNDSYLHFLSLKDFAKLQQTLHHSKKSSQQLPVNKSQTADW